VNASVVLSVVLLFAANVIITQIYATLVPQRVI
jgi:phospholipid/cholesterol/gamma-HCH transport system permease protein